MPKKLFIGFESPVPPRIFPAATSSANRASAGLSELKAYQASVFWHHAMKAVAPQQFVRIDLAAIDVGSQRRKVLARDGGDRIGNRCRRSMTIFVDQYTRC